MLTVLGIFVGTSVWFGEMLVVSVGGVSQQ